MGCFGSRAVLVISHSTSIHSQHQCTNRLQLQVDRGGGRGVVILLVFAVNVKHLHAAAAAVKSTVCTVLRRQWLFAVPDFPGNLAVFRSRKIGNEKVRKTGARE